MQTTLLSRIFLPFGLGVLAFGQPTVPPVKPPVAAAAKPADGVEHIEAEHAPPNGNVVAVVVNDPDATSLTAERPSVEPAAMPGRKS